jgi:ATP-dependent helicase IRC3
MAIKKSFGKIEVFKAENLRDLYQHQLDAKKRMTAKIKDGSDFAGLLVLPTGGGKTFVAVSWALENIINNGGKVLWLAHRKELLNQALETAKFSANDVSMPDVKSFNYRIISGDKEEHGSLADIKPNDDFLVIGKDSIKDDLKTKWLDKNKDTRICVIIDEAHHSTAKTYREVLDLIKTSTNNMQILGLTATPFRSATNEEGLLKKVFKDDIIFNVDLDYLIKQGILSNPQFEDIAISSSVDEESIEKLAKEIDKKGFNDNLPSGIVNQLIANKERSDLIIKTYDKLKYGQCLVFAVNVADANSINGLFIKNGVKSEVLHAKMDNKTRKNILDKYRNSELDILVNVNILTEGTDLPQTKSVFLARPVKSRILLTQMVGRALRGERAGGTKEAYVVNFTLDWNNKIEFTNPADLIKNNQNDFIDIANNAVAQYQMISRKHLIGLTQFLDGNLDKYNITSQELIPVGFYVFSLEEVGERISKEVFVYSNFVENYKNFIDNLETSSQLKIKKIKKQYFGAEDEFDDLVFFSEIDITDIQKYFKQTGEKPKFFEIKNRDKFDLTPLARQCLSEDWGKNTILKNIDELWCDDEFGDMWQNLYHNNILLLRQAFDRESDVLYDFGKKLTSLQDQQLKENTPVEEIKIDREIERLKVKLGL